MCGKNTSLKRTNSKDKWKKGIMCWCFLWWQHVRLCRRLQQSSSSSGLRDLGLYEPGRLLPGHTLPMEASSGISSCPCSYAWPHSLVALGNGTFLILTRLQKVCTYSSSPCLPFFSPFSFFFFLVSIQFWGQKNPPHCFWPGLQLTQLFTAQHPWCFACAKGFSLYKGFPSE